MSVSEVENAEYCACNGCKETVNPRYKYRKQDSSHAKIVRGFIETEIRSINNQELLNDKEFINEVISAENWIPKCVNVHELTFNKDSNYNNVIPSENPQRNCYIILEYSTNQVNVVVVPYCIMSMFNSFSAYHSETGFYVLRLTDIKLNIILHTLSYCAIYYYNYNTYEELNSAIDAEEYPRTAMEYLVSLDYHTRKNIIMQCTLILHFDNLINKCYSINDQEYREKYASQIEEDDKCEPIDLNRDREGEEYEFGEVDPNSPKGDRVINRKFPITDPDAYLRRLRKLINNMSIDTHFLQLPHYYKALEIITLGNCAKNFCVWYDKLVRGETNPEYTDFEDDRTEEEYFHGAAKHTIYKKIPGNPNDIDVVAAIVTDPKNYRAMSHHYFDLLQKAKDDQVETARIEASRCIGVDPEPGITYIVLFEVPKFVTYGCLKIRNYIEQTLLHTAHPLYIAKPLDEKYDQRGAYTVDDFRRVISAVAMKWFEHVFHNNMTFHNDSEIGAAIDRDFYSRFDTGTHIFFDCHGMPLWPYDRYVQMSAIARDVGYYYWAIHCINTIDFGNEESINKYNARWLKTYNKNHSEKQALISKGIKCKDYHEFV